MLVIQLKNLISIGVAVSKLFNLNIDKKNAYSNIDLIIPNDMKVYDENTGMIKYDLTVFFKLPFNFLICLIYIKYLYQIIEHL